MAKWMLAAALLEQTHGARDMSGTVNTRYIYTYLVLFYNCIRGPSQAMYVERSPGSESEALFAR